jgi:hypothetical protein
MFGTQRGGRRAFRGWPRGRGQETEGKQALQPNVPGILPLPHNQG